MYAHPFIYAQSASHYLARIKIKIILKEKRTSYTDILYVLFMFWCGFCLAFVCTICSHLQVNLYEDQPTKMSGNTQWKSEKRAVGRCNYNHIPEGARPRQRCRLEGPTIVVHSEAKQAHKANNVSWIILVNLCKWWLNESCLVVFCCVCWLQAPCIVGCRLLCTYLCV